MTATTLRNTIESKLDVLPMNSDVNKTLGLVIRYTWIGTGALFLCYSYFVGGFYERLL
jgi:hypothetical protein